MEMEKQSTRLNCIIYPEEHNGTILAMYEARIKQLATPPEYIGPNNYDNPQGGLISYCEILLLLGLDTLAYSGPYDEFNWLPNCGKALVRIFFDMLEQCTYVQ